MARIAFCFCDFVGVGVTIVVTLLLTSSGALGNQWTVTSAEDRNPAPPNATPSRGHANVPSTSSATAAIRRAQAVLQNSNASAAEIQEALRQIAEIAQGMNAGGDVSTESSGPSHGRSNDSSSGSSDAPSSQTGNRTETLSPAEQAQQVQQAREAARVQQALQTMASTRAEREHLQDTLISDISSILDAPAGSAAQDSALSQGGRPSNFPDVASEYVAGTGNGDSTSPSVDFLDRTRGSTDEAAADDSASDDSGDATNRGLQWLRDLRQNVGDRIGAVGKSVGSVVDFYSPSAAISRVANADLPQPLPSADDPELPLDPLDVIAMHPLLHLPYIWPVVGPLIDSAKRHYHNQQDPPNDQ